MGGTFDPIHYGHLLAGQEAWSRFCLDRVVFIPNGQPPHKLNYEVSCAEARYEMTVLATAGNPAFEVSRLELDRPGPSYAADTMEQLRRRVGSDARLYLIVGLDAMLEFRTWHDPERVAAQTDFIVVSRSGFDPAQLRRELGEDLMSRVYSLDMPEVGVSSTELRRRAAEGESLLYLTPQPVIRYLEMHGLYGYAQHGGREEKTQT